jgi:PAS domain S-box-containing protein
MDLILNVTDQGIYMLDAEGRCTLFNRAASDMTGWLPKEGVGRYIHELIHHSQESVAPHLPAECSALAVLQTGKSLQKGSEIYWKRDGTPFLVEYTSAPIIEDGRTIGAVVVFADITAREGKIDEHKDAAETYRAFLNILDDFAEERRNVQLLQTATINLLEDMHDERNRVDQTQRATMNILEDFDEEKAMLKDLQVATMNLLEDVEEERHNFQLVQKATLNLLEDMNTEREKSEETQRALINILDDAEVERIKAEKANVLMEAANNELEAFSYSVSHDLRAPLRAISGFTDVLLDDWAPQLDDEGKRFLGLVQENAHKMGQLIDDLLAFSRLSRQTMTVAEIDMAELARSVFEDVQANSPGRGIAFTIGTIPPARGDKALIRQVLVNLISNAVKFTRTRERALIEFGFQSGGDQDAYYIRDNGVGFEMQYVGKLFGVFQRLHSATEFEGTGVGLALVSRIITRHGGTIRAEGQVDQGATFYFSLGTVTK